jgi:hypothetical protein
VFSSLIRASVPLKILSAGSAALILSGGMCGGDFLTNLHPPVDEYLFISGVIALVVGVLLLILGFVWRVTDVV